MLVPAVASLSIALRVARGGGADVTPSADESTVVFSPWEFEGDGVAESAGTLTIRNAAGSPLADKTATGTATDTTVSAASTISITPDEIPDDGTTPASILITVTNGSVPLPGIPTAAISVTSTGSNNTITAVGSVTNAQGQIVYTITSTTAETKTITVEVADLELTDNPTVDVTGDAPATWSYEPVGYVMIAEWDNAASIAPTGFALDGSPNPSNGGTTVRVTELPWTPTHGGPAGIHKHIDAGEPGGFGTGRLEVTGAITNGEELFWGFESYFPADTAVSDQSNKIGFVDCDEEPTQIVIGFQTATDPSTGRPFDNKWRITLEDGFGAGAGQYTGDVSVAYGSAQVHQLLVQRATAGTGVVLHVVDGVVSRSITGLTFPDGVLSRVYIEGTNNGNHSPTASDPRLIALPDGTEHDADWYASIFYLSEPA